MDRTIYFPYSRLITLAMLLFLTTRCLAGEKPLTEFLSQRAVSLNQSQDLTPLVEAAATRKLVLLGEASHGTHEYYVWRDSISRRLIAEHGFRFIAVEGDFASLFALNRYVKNMPGAAASAKEVLQGLSRWPLWMWGNKEIEGLAEWLRKYNENLPESEKVGFYGMDVYDEWRSKAELLAFLKDKFPQIYTEANSYLQCISAWQGDSWAYARAVQQGQAACNEQLQQLVNMLEQMQPELASASYYDYFFLIQNAYVKMNAEKFYRKALTRSDAASWNARAHHMHQTVNRLLDLYGTDAKGIVWAHNTHVGDARFTDMYQGGHQNIGELSRVHHGPENVFSVGFTTYKGRVMAARQWEGRMQDMRIAPARRNSVEYQMYKLEKPAFYLLFDDEDRTHEAFMTPRGHRAVGVVFDPNNEPRQYVNTILPLRYDAFIFFEQTRALNSLHP